MHARLWSSIGCAAALARCAGCGPSAPVSARPEESRAPAGVEAGVAVATHLAPHDPRRWLAGDLHMHVQPMDAEGVVLSISDIAAEAARIGLEFVVLTPHLRPSRWSDDYRRRWRAFAAEARAVVAPTMVPGIEWTTKTGHFTIAGAEIDRIRDRDVRGSAASAGAFVSVNHPFAVPTNIPGVAVSHVDMSYRRWTRGEATDPDLDGVEVWNAPLALANLVSRPGGQTAERHAWSAANRSVHERRQRIAAVGGSDNHRHNVLATTWVLAAEATERAILEALHGAATCIGGPEAGSMRARGDADPPDRWVSIGGMIAAPITAILTWTGQATLFIDDVDVGSHDGGYVHATGGGLHTYRIEQAASRCGFIYANL